MLRIYAPAGHLGHGVPREALEAALKLDPDLVALQGTSTDYGPYYLGANTTPQPLSAIERDLNVLLPRLKKAEVPFIVSCAGPGTDHTLNLTLRIMKRVAERHSLKLDAYVLSGEISKEYLVERIHAGARIRRAADTEYLSEFLTVEDVRNAVRIVAQMGPEPIMTGLKMGVDMVCTGRALDTALFAAYPLLKGYDKGLVMHMSKILECGAMSAEPPTSGDGMFAILEKDHFLVFPTNPKRKATVISIAAHSFYEREDPTREWGPDGYLDLSQARYEQYDERTVMVTGSRWVPVNIYTVKVEGVAHKGYRAVMICGARDPVFLENLDSILNGVKKRVRQYFSDVPPQDYEIHFHVYGRDAVLGPIEPEPNVLHEAGILVEVVAMKRQLAMDICSYIRSTLFHYDHPALRGAAGNLAFPFSPMVLDAGEVYVFNVYHLLPLEDPCEPFRSSLIRIGG